MFIDEPLRGGGQKVPTGHRRRAPDRKRELVAGHLFFAAVKSDRPSSNCEIVVAGIRLAIQRDFL